ncbi:Lithostathine-1 [Aphelenchoides avenae]|nr:Lithostathine-1 [Aphelenchus avenae]
MDASVEQHEAVNGEVNWNHFFGHDAFERIRPWLIREKKLLGVSAAFCLACFVGTLVVCTFMCVREPTAQLPPAQTVPRSCDPGWAEHGGHCYKLLPQKTFYQADHECRFDHGAQLASVHSKEQSDFIGRRAAERLDSDHIGAWIGLQRPKGTNSKWGWTDGTPLDFENWSTLADEDKPHGVSTGQRWCVLIVNGYFEDRTQWNIRDCGRDSETAICQKEL